MKWERITDFRDDAIVSSPRWELVVDECEDEEAMLDIEEHELPSPPAGAIGHAWKYGFRWLCE